MLDTTYATEARRLLFGGDVPWTIVAAPNAGWAQQVFGEPDVERLWAAVGVALRLDDDDVVQAWWDDSALLQGRARALTELGLDAVRYHGGGTDLTVGLVPGCRLDRRRPATTAGVAYMPNLPTEEVFTSPDRQRADGVIAATRPLVMPGAGVARRGPRRHVRRRPDRRRRRRRGVEAVRAQLDTDDGARSLGEVSLVEGTSRVRAAGVVFHDTLYDENTGCHVAWGQGFPFCVPGGMAMQRRRAARRSG